MAEEIIRVTELNKTFAGISAIRNLSFVVAKGQLKGIMGPNGAGKTCLFNVITGQYPATSGEVRYKGTRIDGLRPDVLAGKGIARTFQNPKLFGEITALDNVLVGGHLKHTVGMLDSMFRPSKTAREETRAKKEAMEWLAFVGLERRAAQLARSLPLGEQRLLEVARALAAEPELLLLDEPAGGLNEVEKERLTASLATIKARNLTILLVEHDMNVLMGLADEVLAINFGEKLAEGTPAHVQSHPEVIRAYLGMEAS